MEQEVCVLELVCLMVKDGENAMFGTSCYCRWQFVGVLDVKSLVEHNGEG